MFFLVQVALQQNIQGLFQVNLPVSQERGAKFGLLIKNKGKGTLTELFAPVLFPRDQ